MVKIAIMKTFINICIGTFLLFGPNVSGQHIIDLLKEGKYETFQSHLGDEVKVEFNRTKEVLNRRQALKKIQTRLTKFNPVSWKVLHNGIAKDDDSGYVILKATNSEGNGLRFFMSFDNVKGERKITAVRVRKLL